MTTKLKVEFGLPSESAPYTDLLADKNGGFEDGSGGASNYATGGYISYDGAYKIHTFTIDNDGSEVFDVSNDIVDAEILVVAGGGGASNAPGGGGEVYHRTGVAFTGGNKYDVTVGAGGDGKYGEAITGSKGDDGGNSSLETADGTYTSLGGAGGAKVNGDGTTGGCGSAGGSGTPTSTGGSGSGDDDDYDHGEDGTGNLGYDFPFPTGGGGGAGGRAGIPSSHKGGRGGTGYPCAITGVLKRYGAGGGGTCYGKTGYSAKGGDDGGGDGSPYGGGNGKDGSFYGAAGGGCGAYATGGSGYQGVVMVRYLDAEDYDFDDWTEVAGSGHVFAEEAFVEEGDQACKLSNGAYVHQTLTVTPGNTYRLSFKYAGDGIDGIRYEVREV